MKALDETLEFTPKYDEKGFIPCITVSANTGHVLMFAYMNEAALQKTIETGEVHYWSRSKARLWQKGESSGMVQRVVEIRTDCDQDCLLISVDMEPEASCHTGRRSCFYRKLNKDGGLEFTDAGRIFDPEEVY